MQTFASSIAKVFYGTLIHSVSLKEVEYITRGLLFVDTRGKIAKLLKNVDADKLTDALDGVSQDKVVRLTEDQFVIPGFIDTHIHAPQYTFCGNGHDMPLLEWLDTYTFPRESAFKDPAYAREAYTRAVARSLRNGTTSACWYATIHLEACKELVQVIEEQGQRAYVGKVNMNQNSPDFLVETTESSVADTRAFIEYVKQHNAATVPEGVSPRITPIITPRFAISCTGDLMKQLGQLAKEYNLPVQTHLCENLNEIGFTMSLFPQSTNYTAVYDDHGLLGERTIMAHCVHMKQEELDLMKERKSGISHCANSNLNLKSGLADVRKMLDMDIKVGLGTDVAGGYSPSILDALRGARSVSVARNVDTTLMVAELFYLATVGGARVMELEDTIGNFVVGKEFDAIVVDASVPGSPIDVFAHDTIETKFEKYLFVGDDRNHQTIYVQGKEVRLPGVAARNLRALLNQEIEMEELFEDEGVDEEFEIEGKEEEDIVDSDFDQSSSEESLDEDEEEANVAEDEEEAKKRKKKQALLQHLKTGKSSMSLPGGPAAAFGAKPPTMATGPSKSKVAAPSPLAKKSATATATAAASPSPGATTPTRQRSTPTTTSQSRFMPTEIRKSSRRTTMQNKRETEEKLQAYEARRAAQPKRERVVVHKMTQEELLEEAKKTEQLNLASLQAFKASEQEKRKKVVKKTTGIVGPFIRYHSFTEWVHHGPLIQALAEMAPPGSATAHASPAGTRPSTRPGSRVASRAGSVGPDGQETTSTAATSMDGGGGVPPQRLAQTLAQTLLAQQKQDGKSSSGGRLSRMASGEVSPCRSGSRTPATPMSVDDPDTISHQGTTQSLLRKIEEINNDTTTPSTPTTAAAGDGEETTTPVLFRTMTLSAASMARKRKRLPASQLCGRNWVSFIGFDSDEDLPTNEWSYAENYPEKNPICPITGLPAKYRDPTSGIPYANKEAYKVLQNVMRHGYVWSNGLNAYCHDVGQVLPRNTPAGMADALSGGHPPLENHAIVFNKDGDLVQGGLPGGGGGGYIYRRRTGALASPTVS
ncbi:hypothetical protein BGW42_006046 [Actinomortierella wolfii]|nr:hypothetical protein BGW42_006046 [Actinomortierella wolfii]